MSRVKLEVRHEDLEIKLDAKSPQGKDTIGNSHLLTKVLVSLIEETDVGFWEKNPDEVQPDEFWAAILKALGSNYYFSLDVTPDDPTISAEFLHSMVDDLKRSGYLE